MPDKSDILEQDDFWLAQGRKLITDSIGAQDKAGDALRQGIAWFWSAYTASALISTAIGDRSPTLGITLLLATPSLLLIAAYMLALSIRRPTNTDVFLDSPTSVKDAHELAMRRKSRLIDATMLVVVFAVLSIIAAMVATLRLGTEDRGPEQPSSATHSPIAVSLGDQKATTAPPYDSATVHFNGSHRAVSTK